MSTGYGVNSKPSANSDAYRNNPIWGKPKTVLAFELEPKSGQLVAQSKACKYTSYWIEEGAWCYLTHVTFNDNGPWVETVDTFTSLEDAIAKAEAMESTN